MERGQRARDADNKASAGINRRQIRRSRRDKQKTNEPHSSRWQHSP